MLFQVKHTVKRPYIADSLRVYAYGPVFAVDHEDWSTRPDINSRNYRPSGIQFGESRVARIAIIAIGGHSPGLKQRPIVGTP